MRKYTTGKSFSADFRLPELVISSLTSSFFITKPTNITTSRAISSRSIFEDIQSKRSNTVEFKAQSTPAPPQSTKINALARGRFIPNFSTRYATPTSTREMQEVMAATTTARKKITATIVLITGALPAIEAKT